MAALGVDGRRQCGDALGEPPSERVVEVHPELAFRAIDRRVTDLKVTARGTMQRLDALDACAAAWSAQALAGKRGECVGDGTRDARGRPMRICW